MSHLKRASLASAIVAIGLLGAPATATSSFADGPQQFPSKACYAGSTSAVGQAPNHGNSQPVPDTSRSIHAGLESAPRHSDAGCWR
jgi:hypothetical protein